MRRLVQFVCAIVGNAYFVGFTKGTIYQGPLKGVCFPGMNCYSCPGALFACPIGSLQAVLAQPGALHSISVGKPEGVILFYVLGLLSLIGLLVGRMSCGWVCPFGLIQDLVHKIPTAKIGIPEQWRFMKYAVLVIFVLLFPIFLRDGFELSGDTSWGRSGEGQKAGEQVQSQIAPPQVPGDPWFCKVLCPVGTLEGGIPLISYDRLSAANKFRVGFLFFFKLSVLGVLLVWMILARRPFCRTLCPLGAVWAIFNKVSFYQMQVDTAKCVKCLACHEACPIHCKIFEDPTNSECIRCLQCIPHCPKKCISSGFAPVKSKVRKGDSAYAI